MEHIAILSGCIVSYVSKIFKFGAGATWPGEIALRIEPQILQKLLPRIRKGIIVIAGTNGKTTTSLMTKKILEDQGYSVLHNESGANLLNGIVSAFFTDGRNSFDYAVLEVDENSLPLVLSKIKSQNLIIVLLNLFRDQLDRYGEVDTIAEKWLEYLKVFSKQTVVIVNSDDPHLSFIAKNIHATISYFGLSNPTYFIPHMQHATDTIYCPQCGQRLTFHGIYFSHLGEWSCTKCGFAHPLVSLKQRDVKAPIEGVYNIYNTLAATSVGKIIGIDKKKIQNSINNFTPAFGRMESVAYKGKNIRILLSKNPTGFNESLRTVLSSKTKGPLMLVLNDRIPDGTDVSWIWDVDFEQLDAYQYPLFISGDRALDMAIRIKYGITNYELRIKNKKIILEKNLKEAVAELVSNIQEGQTGWILATYSAMLDVRKILTGKKIL